MLSFDDFQCSIGTAFADSHLRRISKPLRQHKSEWLAWRWDNRSPRWWLWPNFATQTVSWHTPYVIWVQWLYLSWIMEMLQWPSSLEMLPRVAVVLMWLLSKTDKIPQHSTIPKVPNFDHLDIPRWSNQLRKPRFSHGFFPCFSQVRGLRSNWNFNEKVCNGNAARAFRPAETL